jgi:hypothetical protein
MITRRGFGLAGVAAAVVGVLGYRFYDPRPRQVRAILAQEFGDTIARSEDAKAFTDAFIGFSEALGRTQIETIPTALTFIQSTNVIRAMETGDELIFLGLEGPIEAPCQNPLSANWL